MQFEELFSKYVLQVTSKYLHLYEMTWHMEKLYDANECKFTFGTHPDLRLPAEMLGTYDFSTNSFLWSWADSAISEKETLAACFLRDVYGPQHGIELFTKGKIENVEIDIVDYLGVLAAGIFDNIVYYPESGYENSRQRLFLIVPQHLAERENPWYHRALSHLVMLIDWVTARYKCDHRIMVESYCDLHFDYIWDGNKLIIEDNFDGQSRLVINYRDSKIQNMQCDFSALTYGGEPE